MLTEKMLTEKYCPKKCSDVIGQAEAVKKLFLCIQNNKHALVYGPAGTGKTSSVFAVANELGYDVIEMNASDFRSKKKIDEIIGNSVKQQSLFSKSKMILVDELEGLSGQKDRGCLTEILKFMGESRYPIVLVCNRLDRKFNHLKKKCHLVEFSKPNSKLILDFLRIICTKENIDAEDSLLANIACNCGGDIRAALNDTNTLYSGDREKESDIHDALRSIFKSKSASSVLNVFDNLNEDLDECLLWLDENIPQEYSAHDLQKAYGYLSKADIFRKRIFKYQYYRFLNYVNLFLTAGISSAKKRINERNASYRQSSRILKIWIAKQKNIKKIEKAKEMSLKLHCSTKKIMAEMPYLNIIR